MCPEVYDDHFKGCRNDTEGKPRSLSRLSSTATFRTSATTGHPGLYRRKTQPPNVSGTVKRRYRPKGPPTCNSSVPRGPSRSRDESGRSFTTRESGTRTVSLLRLCELLFIGLLTWSYLDPRALPVPPSSTVSRSSPTIPVPT